MNFFSDPEHIWIAVLVGSGVSLVSAVLFAVAVYMTVNPALARFIEEQKERDSKWRRDSDLREESQDAAIGIIGAGLESVKGKLERRDKKDQGIARAIGLIDQRLKTIEKSPLLRPAGGHPRVHPRGEE